MAQDLSGDDKANPFFRRKRENGHGLKSERRIANKELKARLTPASGALPGAKGDSRVTGKHHKFLIQSKATVKKSFSMSYEVLDETYRQALAVGAVPVVTVSFVLGSGQSVPHGDWCLVPLSFAKEMMEVE